MDKEHDFEVNYKKFFKKVTIIRELSCEWLFFFKKVFFTVFLWLSFFKAKWNPHCLALLVYSSKWFSAFSVITSCLGDNVVFVLGGVVVETMPSILSFTDLGNNPDQWNLGFCLPNNWNIRVLSLPWNRFKVQFSESRNKKKESDVSLWFDPWILGQFLIP